MKLLKKSYKLIEIDFEIQTLALFDNAAMHLWKNTIFSFEFVDFWPKSI